jgi:hypothetical protein
MQEKTFFMPYTTHTRVERRGKNFKNCLFCFVRFNLGICIVLPNSLFGPNIFTKEGKNVKKHFEIIFLKN